MSMEHIGLNYWSYFYIHPNKKVERKIVPIIQKGFELNYGNLTENKLFVRIFKNACFQLPEYVLLCVVLTKRINSIFRK